MSMTRSTRSSSCAGVPESDTPKVFTHLDETMRRLNIGEDYPSLNISPWLISCEQEEKTFNVKRAGIVSQQILPRFYHWHMLDRRSPQLTRAAGTSANTVYKIPSLECTLALWVSHKRCKESGFPALEVRLYTSTCEHLS